MHVLQEEFLQAKDCASEIHKHDQNNDQQLLLPH